MVYFSALRFSLFGSRWGLIGILGALLLAAILFFGSAMLIRRVRHRHASDESSRDAMPVSAVPILSETTNPLPSLRQLVSPLSGKMIEPDEHDSELDAACQCIILPSEGRVYAPFDCTVVSQSARSLTLEGEENVKVTVEIGKHDPETVERDFIPCCRAGDKVKEGDLLLSFDMEALEKADYDLTSAVWVENADDFAEIKFADGPKVAVGEHLMTLVPKHTPNGSPQ